MNQFRFDSDGFRNRAPYFTTAVLAGLISAFLVLLAVRFTGLGVALVNPPIAPVPSTPIQTQQLSLNEYEKATIDVVNRVGPSVVMIMTNTKIEDIDYFAGPEVNNIQGLGSGLIFRQDGYILTNNHVVNGTAGMANKVMVVLSDGRTASTYPARIVGVDPQTDLAVLKIDRNNLPVPGWGDSERVQVGQIAIAIGNPLAENLKNTVTVGVISAKGLNIKVTDDLLLRNMLQTDASINPGNSGGPLLDSSGNIIGINSLIGAGQGIAFSIPGNTAKAVADQLINKGRVSRPGLGIAYIHFTPESVSLLEGMIRQHFPVNFGFFIAKVVRNSPADKAGLKPGDVMVEVNGQQVEREDLIQSVNYPMGAKIKVKYYRGQEVHQTTVVITETKK